MPYAARSEPKSACTASASRGRVSKRRAKKARKSTQQRRGTYHCRVQVHGDVAEAAPARAGRFRGRLSARATATHTPRAVAEAKSYGNHHGRVTHARGGRREHSAGASARHPRCAENAENAGARAKLVAPWRSTPAGSAARLQLKEAGALRCAAPQHARKARELALGSFVRGGAATRSERAQKLARGPFSTNTLSGGGDACP